ncbi:MAG TPA: phytanoyl-CoA dioxygenase family protein [Burkholderiales bacterium]|jgi:hypothetical protein|nr:phytanoyl-CoA dioxygenase family protein [Burkholderiales bacterium]
MSTATSALTVRKPTLWDHVRSRLVYSESYAKRRLLNAPSTEQQAHVETLRRDGYVTLDQHIPVARLRALQSDLDAAMRELEFETPCLAQSRVDPERHHELIRNFMYGSAAQLAEWGVAFDRSEAQSYEQVVRDFNPSTLTLYMLERSEAFRQTWLDPYLLDIVTSYMGIVPKLSEAYVRRNFPAPHRTMNHYWHRDLNAPVHLLKIFFFLSDCGEENGPHDFVRASHKNLDVLNGKRYFSDDEVDCAYPPGGKDRIVSIVKAGTVVIEDTRGLHRAQLPQAGFRDLGYAVFVPLRPFYPHRNYGFPRAAYDQLTPLQQAFIPPVMLV